jgi:hypothetical protein
LRPDGAFRFVAAAAVVAALAAGGAALAEDDAHDHGHGTAERDLSQLTAQQRADALEAWKHVYCNCPKENWSRLLIGCPDGCADTQKQQILARIVEGWDRERIVAEQVRLYGTRADASPGTAVDGSLLVLAGLVIGAGAAGAVLAGWRRSAAARRVVSEAERAASPVAAAEAASVERELREIE